MTHAFYAIMGGFVIDTHPADMPASIDGSSQLISGKEYIHGSPLLTVTGQGIYFLTLNGIVHPISEVTINDKSKTNSFAKIFACIQGSWLII